VFSAARVAPEPSSTVATDTDTETNMSPEDDLATLIAISHFCYPHAV
jgi:hypothetical protein